MTAEPRTIQQVDSELSALVKARSGNKATIRELSGRIVDATRRIDALLAERSLLAACPEAPGALVAHAQEVH